MAKPNFADRITCEILKCENTAYESHGSTSPECGYVVCGHAVAAFTKFFMVIKDKVPVAEFIKRQLQSPRQPTAQKAEEFFKSYKVD